MRRSALHLGIPIVCALLGVLLIGASGKADESALPAPSAPSPLPDLAMAVTRTSIAIPTPAALAAPTTRPATGAAEMLITSAPTQIGAITSRLIPSRPRIVMMEVTAYCACKKCCGPRAQGITASGKRVNFNKGRFVAADKNVFEFNTKLKIPGYANEQPVPVLDRGGAIKGNKLDVFFASHTEALKWGRQKIAVTVVE